MTHDGLTHLIQHYGYGFIGLTVGLESLGVPLPGESVLIAAALYAGSSGQLNIVLVVLVTALGACLGDNGGYLIGRTLGLRLLARYGTHVGLTERRLEIGHALFRRYGGKVVFFGRFVGILRTFAALLAGANRMPWRTFLFCNLAGGCVWSATYGFAAWYLGDVVRRMVRPVGIGLAVAALVVVAIAAVVIRHHERWLTPDR
jgi:membrane protein DedA with SNARE-associated domain